MKAASLAFAFCLLGFILGGMGGAVATTILVFTALGIGNPPPPRT